MQRCSNGFPARKGGRHCRDGNVINGARMAVRTVGKTKKKKRVTERRKNEDDHKMESN